MLASLRTTYDARSTRLLDDPVTRYMHALLAQILAMLESDGETPSHSKRAVHRA